MRGGVFCRLKCYASLRCPTAVTAISSCVTDELIEIACRAADGWLCFIAATNYNRRSTTNAVACH